MGGAQALNYIVGLVRVKAVAILLGPSGVGVIGLYTSATNLIGAITEFGLQSSSVRSIAYAQGHGDPEVVARTIRMLRRLCWATGGLGWLVSAALAIPLSNMLFGDTTHAWAYAVLGAVLLMNAVSGGQLALLQGLRRIGDIARVQVAAAALNTAVTVLLYVWLRDRGIVPVLLANAAISLSLSWSFARRVKVDPVVVGWRDAVETAKPMLGLGVAMMWSSVLTLAVALFTRTVIKRELGIEAVGIYDAAWALSGLFAGFVLTAMGADFYPRLTAVINDRDTARRVVNEQTEIGVLLAVPGLLFTLALAPLVVRILYSAEFAPAADVLSLMVLGVFGRVLSWPLGFIQLALGLSRWVIGTEAAFLALQALLVLWGVPRFGVTGAAYAFVGCYLVYLPTMTLVARRLADFQWSTPVVALMLQASALVALAFAASKLLPTLPLIATGTVLAAAGALWSVRELTTRLGRGHRLIRAILRVPGASRVLAR